MTVSMTTFYKITNTGYIGAKIQHHYHYIIILAMGMQNLLIAAGRFLHGFLS